MKSKAAYILCLFIILYASFGFYPRWNQSNIQAVIAYDVAGYYWYLPSIFIYHDLKEQRFQDSVIDKYQPTGDHSHQGFQCENGNYVMKYSSGMALMYLPFFTVANLVAEPLGYPPDGFSIPYQLAIQIGGVLVALLGLWYFRKFLLYLYNDTVVAVCLVMLVFGTNYLEFAAINNGMSHSWLFTVYVFLLLNTWYFYQKPSYKYAIWIGLLIGLATLTRPTDIISCLIPLLWGLQGVSKATLRSHFSFLKSNAKFLWAAAVCTAAVASIQAIYWKYVSGSWLVYSYGDQGFDWVHAHVKDYIFSSHNGWLAYTPTMFFAFVGIYYIIKQKRNAVAIVTFFLLNLYIVSAWDFWYYGGRFMIQSYAVLFLPIAALINAALNNKYLKIILAPLFLLCIYINIWYTYQAHGGGLYDMETTSDRYYFAVLGRWHVPEETAKLKDTDELFEGDPKNMHLLYENDFDNDTISYCDQPPISGKKSICLDRDHQHSQNYTFPYANKSRHWIRAQATFKCIYKEWYVWNMTQFTISFMKNGTPIKNNLIRVYRFLNNGDVKDIFIDAKTPEESYDSINIHFWNPGSDQTLIIDNLKVWEFDGD